MRPVQGISLSLLVLPLALAACGGAPPPPPPTPVVINTPPAPPPAPQVTAVLPSTPVQTSLVSQCQDLFARALNGEPVNYGSPAVTSVGEATTVHLVAQPVSPTPSAPVLYSCNYSGTTLTAAGMN
jgi:hypothetical protein